jgi:hypothetical protein
LPQEKPLRGRNPALSHESFQNASKDAILSFTRSLALDHGPDATQV